MVCSFSQKAKATNTTIQTTTDSISKPNTKSELVEPLYETSTPTETSKKVVQKKNMKSEFRNIISAIPITPLPFGVKNLDDIDCSYPSNYLLKVLLSYDKDNTLGLNTYFYDNKDIVDPLIYEYDGRYMPNLELGGEVYFSRRLPNLNTDEYVPLFYLNTPEGVYYINNWTSTQWLLVICEPNGLVICEPNGKIKQTQTSVFSADNYLRLSYIDEDIQSVPEAMKLHRNDRS